MPSLFLLSGVGAVIKTSKKNMDTWVWVVIALVLIGVVVFFLKSKKEDGASEQVKDFAASEKTENVEDSSVSENSSQEKKEQPSWQNEDSSSDQEKNNF